MTEGKFVKEVRCLKARYGDDDAGFGRAVSALLQRRRKDARPYQASEREAFRQLVLARVIALSETHGAATIATLVADLHQSPELPPSIRQRQLAPRGLEYLIRQALRALGDAVRVKEVRDAQGRRMTYTPSKR